MGSSNGTLALTTHFKNIPEIFQAKHKALLDVPPNFLNIADGLHHQHSAKKAIIKTQPVESSSSALPEWIQQIMGVMLMNNLVSNRNNIPVASLPTTPTTPANNQTWQQTTSTPVTSTSILKRPGSPLEYPFLSTWLDSIERHPSRSKKTQGFHSFSHHLSANGVDDLEDLMRLTSEELMGIIPGINIGTAKHSLAFSQEDVLELQERKRIHLQ
jgi:hypothetical protein